MDNIGGFEKVVLGSGGGGGLDPSTALLMGMMNKQGDGSMGGNSAIWIILLIALLRGGVLGGGLCGTGAAAAAGIANCQDFLAVINAIGGVKEQVANSLAAQTASVNTVGDRVIASSVAATANLTDKLNSSTGTILGEVNTVKNQIGAFSAESSNRFFAVQREMDQNNFAVNSNMTNNFNSLNQYLCNAFNAQTQNFNSLSRQLSDSTCLLSKEIEKTQCMVATSEERVLAAIANSAKDQTIAALQAQVCALKDSHSNDRINQIIAVNSTLQNQIGTIASALTNGRSNGNS